MSQSALSGRQASAAEPAPSCNYPANQPWASEPTSRVSVNSSGGSITDQGAVTGPISANGRHASFMSYSGQHVAGDTNGVADIFTRDRETKTTTRESVTASGVQGNRNSSSPAVSSDGRHVAFSSEASSLSGGDGDFSAHFSGVGFQPDGVQLANGWNTWQNGLTFEAWVNPQMTASWGRIFDFGNGAGVDNIVWGREGTTNNVIFHVYNGTTVIGSVRATDVLEYGKWQHMAVTLAPSGAVSMYKDGVLRSTGSSGLPPNVGRSSNFIGGSNWDGDDEFGGRLDEVAIYYAPLSQATVTSHYQARFTNYASKVLSDGVVTYWRLGERSGTTALDSGPYAVHGTYRNGVSLDRDGALSVDSNDTDDVFVRDRQTGQTNRISLRSDGTDIGNTVTGNAVVMFDSRNPEISGDGRHVVFGHFGALDPADTNGNLDVYLRDRDTDGNRIFDEAGKVSTTRVSVSSSGAQGNDSQTPSMSPDARHIAFTSHHPFDPADTNGGADIYARDRLLGTTSLISRTVSGAAGLGPSHYSSVSADGRYFGFSSAAGNLVGGDNNVKEDSFVRDRTAGTTALVSVRPDGQPGNNHSGWYPNVSADGRRVAFGSSANDLVTGDTNNQIDVFVRDLVQSDPTKATQRVSVGKDNNQSSTLSFGGYTTGLSADGRYASFRSAASGLVEGDSNGLDDSFLRDLGAMDGHDLAPTLGAGQAAQSDEVGLEQFYPYASTDLGSGTAYTHLRSGNLVASFQDATVPGDGLNAVVRHTYNSKRAAIDTGAGAGWSLGVGDIDAGEDGLLGGMLGGLDLAAPLKSFSVGKMIAGLFTPTGQILEFTDDDGTTHRFFRSGGPCSHWVTPPGVDLKVREIFGANPSNGLPDAYELIRPDGVVYRVEKTSLGGILPTTEYRIGSVSDRSQNKLTYAYERFGINTRLRSITHNRYPASPVVRFDYSLLGDLNKIVTRPQFMAPDPSDGGVRSWERHIYYNIDPVTKQLRSVTKNGHKVPAGGTAAERTTTFAYSLGNLLSSVKDGRDNSAGFSYLAGKISKITDRRGKDWNYSYTSQADGTTDTAVTSPVGAPVTYKVSARGPIGGGDERVAGGNVTSITDAGHGEPPTPVTTSYGWNANRLISSKDGAGIEKTMEYNDLGLLTKVTEPPPNAASNPSAPDAVTTPIVSKLEYGFPAEWGDDPTRCTQPASSGPVSTEGYCFAVAELTRSTFADNHASQRRITDFGYDPQGNLTRTTERANPDPAVAFDAPPAAADRSTAYTYYTRGSLKTIDGPRSDVSDVTTFGDTADTTYGGYDRTGQPSKVTDAASKISTFSYTPYGPLAKVVDRDAKMATAKYDEADNLVQRTDPALHTASFRYDANDNQTHATSPKGTATATIDDHTAITTFDSNDWPTQLSTPGVTPTGPRMTVKKSYADDGRVATQTSARDAVTSYSYWPNRLVKSVDAPAQGTTLAVTEMFYDQAGRVSRTIGAVANEAGARPEAKPTYNPDGSVASTEQTSPSSAPAVVRYSYNAHGEQVRTEGPRKVGDTEQVSLQEYDRLGQAIKSKRNVSPDRFIEYASGYDLAGNLISSTQPNASGGQLVSTFTYDGLNRLSGQSQDPVNPGHTAAYAYDGEGRQLSRTDKVNGTPERVTSQTYNPAGTAQTLATTSYGAETKRLLSCNFAQGAAPGSGYDADQNLLETRTVTVAGAGSGSDVTDCDVGNLERRQSFTYNEPGLLTDSTQRVRSPETGAMVERSQSFAHGPDGRVSSATLATPGAQSYQSTFDYTAAGWSEKTTDWRNKATSLSYLASGTPKSQTVGAGVAAAEFEWYPESSPKKLTWKNSTGLTVREHKEISYDAGGLKTSEEVLVLQPGAKSPGGAKASYTYDLADRLTSWTSPFVDLDSADRLKSTYALDDAGNITAETVTKATSGLQASKTTYSYQNTRLSRRDGETAGVLGPTVGTDTYTYNGLGEETLRENTAGKSVASAYDPAGHHQAYDDRSEANKDVTYVYDAQDQVISRNEPGAPAERAKATVYFHDASTGALIEEADGLGNTLVRYLNDADADPIAQQGYKVANGQRDASDTAGTWKWLLPDVNASVATHLLDSGEVAEQAAWDPYGRPEKAGSSVTDQSKKGSTLGFQGATTDKVTGNLLLGARQYDPGTGRFLTPDTFVAGQLDLALGNDALTGNRYLFAAANPTAFFDDGHSPSPIRQFWKKAKRRAWIIGFVPWVGTATDAASAASGRNVLEGGQRLSGLGRAGMVGSALLGLVPGAKLAVKGGAKLAGKIGSKAAKFLGSGKVVRGVAPNTAGSIRRVNPLGGTQNCVNCAIATDATLAGRPASALTSSGPQPISILERTFGGSFKPISGADEIRYLLMDAGPGARGIVFGTRGADPGHVFNAVNQRGVVRFLDGQSGGPASFEGFDAFHFLRTGP